MQAYRRYTAVEQTRRAASVSSQNVPLSKRPTVKTSHAQNVPSQNVPFLKQNVPVGQNVPSQNVPMLMS